MCGFSGFLSPSRFPDHPGQLLAAMGQSILHRGPDSGGQWWDAQTGIGFSHRRLAILDLSEAGHQPMRSACGRYVIVFNGEIYNHLELRKQLDLDGCVVSPVAELRSTNAWRGHSDTETLLAAISAWGIESSLKKTVGMFALALWDSKEECLFLARDRFGEKPLYYGVQNGSFLFGSELKALKLHPDFRAEIDRDAIASYLRHNYIPSPYSIYQNIYKLTPGALLRVNRAFESEVKAYWSAREIAESGQRNPFAGDEYEAQTELARLLKQSIGAQMIADVPLGAFLSGGVDSSAVVALMQAQSTRPVKTFTIGFREQAYNEAEYAHAVAKHLGTEHTELYVSPEQAMAVIPDLPQFYDEPFADSSQIPTWLVSKLAREQVTVSLSGDGGDELFGGYNRYFLGLSIWNKVSLLPLRLRSVLAGAITLISADRWNAALGPMTSFLPARLRFGNLGDKLHKLAHVLRCEDPETLYFGLLSLWKNPAAVVLSSREPNTLLNDRAQWPELDEFAHRMMALDTLAYLPDDILVKVDRAAMSVSLESRVPLLDHRIFEFAWRLPLSMKIQKGHGKHLLRQVLYEYVPKALIERPKMGFGIPLDQWLRGPLRDWADCLLDERRLRQEGFFEPALVRKKWLEHSSGSRNWQYQLWCVLMFEAWLEHQRAN